MDIGQIKVRCQGVNVLHGAIHEQHGLAWTDGQGIFLTPVSLFQGQIENQEHNKLGEFTRGVKSIHWSDSVQPELCYMCVVHEHNISIWKVEGHQTKLAFKQIRKINIQPVPQGCLWNPGRDILCVLCPQQSSLYYSHTRNKGSQVLLQLERDKIRCGCWSTDGVKLVICIGTSLMVYHWSDIDSSVTQYTTISWTVPGLTGHISSVVAVQKDRIITAGELPLESLCKQQDTFLVPDLLNSNSNKPITDELPDADILIPKGNGTSITESLLNLQRNPNTVVEDSSRLDCIEICEDKDPVRLCSVRVKGVLTPDLLLYVESHSLLLVGSNSQTLLQIFSYNKDQLSKYQEILVNKDERPKGVANLPKSVGDNCGVLILLGKKDLHDSAFPSSSSYIKMKSVMKFFHIKQGRYEKNPLTHTVSAPSIPMSVASNGHQEEKDYDSIYEKVLNFDTKLKNGVSNLSKSENKENNNSVKIEEIAEQKTAEQKVLSEIPKQNGESHHSNANSQTISGTKENAEPPKRPVRKKRSMRQGRDEAGKYVTSNGTKTEPEVKMPMEYLSDSPEMSPRDCDRKNEKSNSLSKIAESVPRTDSNDINSPHCESESRLAGSVISESKLQTSDNQIVSSVNEPSEISTPLQKDSSAEITTLKLGVNNSDANSVKSRIVEIGDDANLSVKDLEVEKADFSSQKRNFKHGDIQALCSEESHNQKLMEDYCKEKMKSVETSNSNIPDVAGAQSVSMESLEDIDKILKEQNGKITKLQEQMNRLSRRIDESTCVLPYRYKPVNKPDLVQVCFCCKDGFKIEKKFLLDNGRIQLEQIKQAFSLETVEIFIDDEACVVGCNIDGYIPLKFEPGSSVNIRGKPAMS